MIDQITAFLAKPNFHILEAVQLQGAFISICETNRAGRPLFFNIQNAIRQAIRTKYHSIKGYHARKLTSFKQSYPHKATARILKQVSKLIHREVAQMIYATNTRIVNTPWIKETLRAMLTALQSTTQPWEISIGHIVPRDSQFLGNGDASTYGTAAYSPELKCFFIYRWGPDISARLSLPPSHKNFTHINYLEYLTSILLLSMMIQRLENHASNPDPNLPSPHSIPAIPMATIESDNMTSESWTGSISSKSRIGQQLVTIQAALMQRSNLGIKTKWLSTHDNKQSDYLSRLAEHTPPTHPFPLPISQVFQRYPQMQHWHFFHPAPALLQLSIAKLSSNAPLEIPQLPKHLGHFELISSTSPNISTPTI